MDDASLAGLRPRYRVSAYVFGQRGYAIQQQLPGPDRPAQVAEVYRDPFRWADFEGRIG
jgi:hypothetical protein